MNFNNFDNSYNSFLWPECIIDFLCERWIPCEASTSVLCLHYRPRQYCSTKNAYTSEITFLALQPWYCKLPAKPFAIRYHKICSRVHKIVIILSQRSHSWWVSLHENMKEFELPVLIGSYRSSDDRIQSRRSPKFIIYHIFISLRSRCLKVGLTAVCLENCQDYSNFTE